MNIYNERRSRMGNGDIDVKSKGKDLKEEMGGGERWMKN